MKKGNILNIVLAIVAIAAIVFAVVTNGQKGDLQKQVTELTSKIDSLNKDLATAKSDAEAAAKAAQEELEAVKKAAEEAAQKAAEEAAKAAEEAVKQAASATTGPAGYPEVVPGMDFGGETLHIRLYWGPDQRSAEPTEEQQAQYDYRDWIMKTYNVNVVEEQLNDWDTCAQEMINFATANNGEKVIYVIEPGKAPSVMSIAAPWNDIVDLTAEKWNKGDLEFMTKGGKTYGVYSGPTEPRQLLYFNKRLLQEANIDPETIYDMQANNTWTWDAFVQMLAQTTRDTDNDGANDTFGIVGSFEDYQMISVFTNGGSFFEFDENGLLKPVVDSDEAKAALNWAKDVREKYWMPQPEGANWDWYKEAFKSGGAAFYMYQGYGGFKAQDTNTELNGMADEWGAVAFPTPKGGNYVTIASDNFWMIPNVYDAETLKKIGFIYDLWTNDTPGYEDADENWQGLMYSETDDRAVDETYAMLRHSAVTNKTTYLGTVNDVLGNSLLWSLPYNDVDSLIEAGMPAWQALCDTFNAK